MSAHSLAPSANAEEKKVDVAGQTAPAGPIQADTADVYQSEEGSLDPVYQAKARILNDALQEIGMGKYQVCSHFGIHIASS
jgi:hypothetical protein